MSVVNFPGARITGQQSMPDHLHIVFRDFPGPGNECVFVEVETPDGQSINAGEWRKRDDGFVELVIAARKRRNDG